MTQLGHEVPLFDHLVGACQQRARHIETERLGGPACHPESSPAASGSLPQPPPGNNFPRLSYERAVGRRSQPSSTTAMIAPVRLVTFRALRTAVTWFLTVGSVRSSARPIALLLLPCITRARTSTCLSVNPRSRG